MVTGKRQTYATLLAALFLLSSASAQIAGGQLVPSTTSQMGTTSLDPMLDLWMLRGEKTTPRNQLESPSDTISKLDLKAPGPARQEYEKGMEFLIKKNFNGATARLSKCIALYPNFVAAHNALGSAYMDLGRHAEAQGEFTQAVSLDDHIPYSFLNLGRSQLALKNYPAAQESIRKASSLSPLDLPLLTALTYAEFLNHDYNAVIATAQQVHERKKHEKAAIVHYFAAAAWQGQDHLDAAQHELDIFLGEDPASPVAENARHMIAQLKDRAAHPAAPKVEIAYAAAPNDSNSAPDTVPSAVLRKLEEARQVKEAEAEADCESCAAPSAVAQPGPDVALLNPITRSVRSNPTSSAFTIRSSVNEVAVFFAATDHGQSVTDLTRQQVDIRDNGKPPSSILGFRNESQLPLRLGLLIDTSASITHQFSFEQSAASSFLHNVVTTTSDQVFVVGFSSSVLLVQDFTSDDAKISHGVDQLAPAGGTALWDAVKFAADKLAHLKESKPVARILVIVSDGDDNASTATLNEAIETAERGEIILYTVSTRELAGKNANAEIADRAMKVLALRTGGAAFFPNSLSALNRRLADLQQVIRSRYLISYKPSRFEINGKYRPITIAAQKSGHKLHIYARRGYYANPKSDN